MTRPQPPRRRQHPDDLARVAAPDDGRPGGAAWFGVALIAACAVLAALIELLLVPLYAGPVLIPIGAVAAIVTNVAFPRMATALVRSTLAAVVPFLGWLVVAVGFGVLTRPEGDVILPGGGYVEYVGYVTLLGGALAGTISVVLCSPPPRPRR